MAKPTPGLVKKVLNASPNSFQTALERLAPHLVGEVGRGFWFSFSTLGSAKQW